MNTSSAPTQVLLPGQAAAPAGPSDLTGMYVMHHAFRRDLARFVAAAGRTPVTDTGTWTALARRWSHFARELHHHHTKEDAAIWPLLLERADDADRVVLAAMEAEHEAIDPLLHRVEDALGHLAAGTFDTGHRDELTAAWTELHAGLDAHLAHEEVAAIPIIQTRITAAEWTHLEETELQATGSLRQLMFMLPWVADGLPPVVLARLLGGAPLPVRVLLALGRRGYEQLGRRAFVHAD